MEISPLREKYTVELHLADLEGDPYPILKKLRTDQPVAWLPGMGLWLVTRWDEVMTVNTQPDLFTAETTPSFLGDALGPNMLALEGPPAQRLKEAMLPPFLTKGSAGWYVAERMVAVADELIDQMAAEDGCDLMSAYAAPFSTISLQVVLGLDQVPWQKMWAWCQGVCAGIVNWEGDPDLTALADQAKAALSEVILEKIDQVKRQPDHSAISHMVHLKNDRLTEDEIINNVRLMISGGINEPRDGIGLAAHALFSHPQLKQQVLADERLWPKLVNEVFRFYSPVGTSTRQTTGPVTLAGVALPAGELIAAVLTSANRDEAHWSQPERFDIHRREGQNLAFAIGQHKCLGAWLGFQEVLVGTKRLFERLPHLRPQSDEPVEISGFEFRGPKHLAVVWDPQRKGNYSA